MYDFTGSIGGSGWGIVIDTGGAGGGYGGYGGSVYYPPYGGTTQYPPYQAGLGASDKQLLMLGAIVLVAYLVTKR